MRFRQLLAISYCQCDRNFFSSRNNKYLDLLDCVCLYEYKLSTVSIAFMLKIQRWSYNSNAENVDI